MRQAGEMLGKNAVLASCPTEFNKASDVWQANIP
jgi:hypothetical protein